MLLGLFLDSDDDYFGALLKPHEGRFHFGVGPLSENVFAGMVQYAAMRFMQAAEALEDGGAIEAHTNFDLHDTAIALGFLEEMLGAAEKEGKKTHDGVRDLVAGARAEMEEVCAGIGLPSDKKRRLVVIEGGKLKEEKP